MLIHHSSTRKVHDDDKGIVETIFNGGGRYQEKSGFDSLKTIFENDFKLVSKVRAPGLPFPNSFEELLPYISSCITRVCDEKAVVVVNGDEKNQGDTPAFDQNSVWAILIGGAKLSRGYTIEGLTISYYRRPTGAGDTLMQMGRWFGFRPGYRDLVRLYIGTKEPRGKTFVDLYNAFGAVCRDEESLRHDLMKYSKSALTPKQVPPLVMQHLPQLPPTASNKMFNAEIRSRDFAGEWTEKTIAPTQVNQIKENQLITTKLLNASNFSSLLQISFNNHKGNFRKFNTYIGLSSGEEILGFLQKYTWANDNKAISLEIDYIETMLNQNRLKRWLILLPQLESSEKTNIEGLKINPISIVTRSRVTESRFGVYSEPRHRESANFLSG
jgi:hypothetical protein